MTRRTMHEDPKWKELVVILKKVIGMEAALRDGDTFMNTIHAIYYLFSGKEAYSKFIDIPSMLSSLPVEVVDQFLSVSFPVMCSDVENMSPIGVLPFLHADISGLISFTPLEAYYLLICCFLCIPLSDDGVANFSTTCHLFFTNRPRICSKLHCLLNYFNVIVASKTTDFGLKILLDRSVRLERLVESKLHGAEWWMSRTDALLSPVCVQSAFVPIESLCNALHANFANKHIGGGVLRRGCVQEEIRMMIAPELVLGVILADPIGDNESVVISGTVQFNKYSGYATSFKCLGLSPRILNDQQPIQTDTVVCMDAIPFGLEKNLQYHLPLIVRELEKCRIALAHTDGGPSAFATGNWGCGVFGGDPQLKFVIQWLAASMCGRPLWFCPFDDTNTVSLIQRLYNEVANRKISVGHLFSLLVEGIDQIANQGTIQVLLERVCSHTSEASV